MPFNILGKIMFPRLQRSERIHKAKTAVGVLFASLIFAGIVGAFIYLQNFNHH